MQRAATTVKELIVGFIAGITSMLPGVSGATMAVVFGIYERLIRDLAALRQWIRKDFGFLFTVFIGFLVGTFLAAKVLDTFANDYAAELNLFFLGLIAGQMPAVMADAGVKDRGRRSAWAWAALAAGVLIMISTIIANEFLDYDRDIAVSHDIGFLALMVVVGIVIAISALLPGLSHSTILLVFGLFNMFTAAISNFDVVIIGSIAVGAVIGVLLFSKVIGYALREHRNAMMMLILGLTAGSLITICYFALPGLSDPVHIAASIVTLIAGVATSYGFTRIGRIEEDPAQE